MTDEELAAAWRKRARRWVSAPDLRGYPGSILLVVPILTPFYAGCRG